MKAPSLTRALGAVYRPVQLEVFSTDHRLAQARPSCRVPSPGRPCAIEAALGTREPSGHAVGRRDRERHGLAARARGAGLRALAPAPRRRAGDPVPAALPADPGRPRTSSATCTAWTRRRRSRWSSGPGRSRRRGAASGAGSPTTPRAAPRIIGMAAGDREGLDVPACSTLSIQRKSQTTGAASSTYRISAAVALLALLTLARLSIAGKAVS